VVRVGKFTGTAAVKKEGKLKEVRSQISFACMIIIYVMTKKHTTDHHVKEMVDSISQKKT